MSFAWATWALACAGALLLTLALDLRLRLARLAALARRDVAAARLAAPVRDEGLATIRAGLDALHAAAGRLQEQSVATLFGLPPELCKDRSGCPKRGDCRFSG